MAEVIDFPGRTAPTPGEGEAERQRLARAFACDTDYAVAVLSAKLPREALDRIAGLELRQAASGVVLALYEVHEGRRRDPRYDERRQEGVVGALARMYRGDAAEDEPEPPGVA